MKKIVNFDVNAEHYIVDAVFVWCFDQRFEGLENGVREYYGFGRIDPVNVAGGVKDISSGSYYSKKYLLEQIDASIKLHDAKSVVLMAHVTCGAYGRTFDTNEKDRTFYCKELEEGERIVSRHLRQKGLAHIRIIKIYADFTGAFEV